MVLKVFYRCQISPFFPFCMLHAHQRFLQDFLKLAFFLYLVIHLQDNIYFSKFSISLKSLCLKLAIFLKFIFKQKKKRGFIWPKTFDFLFQKHSNFYLEKELKEVAVPEFKNIKRNNFQF